MQKRFFYNSSNNIYHLVVSLDMQDELGSHVLDVKDTLQKVRLTSNGQIIHEVIISYLMNIKIKYASKQ